MSNSAKDQSDVICRGHSARTERDLYRICPSKLSKRELEDLYFALLENNVELKKTINVQQDKIKIFSTRLQRLTAQKNGAGKENCCTNKAVVIEQGESISDLKKVNERMAERIRILNMRLCSAKQFLKKSPSQANCCKNCARCSLKNSSMSALHSKRSDANIKKTVSCQCLLINGSSTKTAETETEMPEKDISEKICTENKCKIAMDELKEKINNLQEELLSSHNEYSQRISNLESQVSELNDENLRVRGERAASEHALQERAERADQLQRELRTADAKYNDVSMELTIEKKKVTELETGLKLANMSTHVMKTIDEMVAEKEDEQVELPMTSRESLVDSEQLTVENIPSTECIKSENVPVVSQGVACCEDPACLMNAEKAGPSQIKEQAKPRETPSCLESSCTLKLFEKTASQAQTLLEPNSSVLKKNGFKEPKSDDSGFTDLNKSSETENDQAMFKTNQNLLQKIAELQAQIDMFKICAAGEAATTDKHSSVPKEFETYDEETKDTQSKLSKDSTSTIMEAVPTSEKSSFDVQHGLETRKPVVTPVKKDQGKATSSKYEGVLASNQSDEVPSKPCEDSAGECSYVEDNAGMQSREGPSGIRRSLSNTFEDVLKPAKEDYNRCQMPATMPSVLSQRDKRSNQKQQSSKDSYSDRLRNRKPNSEEKSVKIFEDSKDSCQIKCNNRAAELSKGNLKEYSKDQEANEKNNVDKKKIVSITDTQDIERVPSKIRDSIVLNKKKMSSTKLSEVKKESTTSCFMNQGSSITPPPEKCKSDHYTEMNGVSDEDGPQPPSRRDSATYTADAPNTYTVPKTRSRATSPDNTEHEISSLTDLPSEKDVKPRPLSPGEQKAAMTSTDSSVMRSIQTDDGLSEGEMITVDQIRRLSAGEKNPETCVTPYMSQTTQKMESTLQAISEELAKCRALLLSQRPREVSESCSRRVSPEPSRAEEVHGLRPTPANRKISGKRAPACVFILHIGTLILSDEAVQYCRDKSVVLTWRFYAQSAAMTRVPPGRVALFDFSTEYDLCMDDDFLDYMKHGNLSIVLSETNKQDEPFAMCSLPLREPLLHANYRADLSLALVPCLPLRAAGAPSISLGEELGVLDLWCMLKVDDSIIPTINRSMTVTCPPPQWNVNPLRNNSKIMRQLMVEPSSADLDMDLGRRVTTTGTQATAPPVDQGNLSPTFEDAYQPSHTVTHEPSTRYDNEVKYHPCKPYHRQSSTSRQKSIASDINHRGQVGFQNENWPSFHHESAGIVINAEVPAHIKSGEDMKQALGRNTMQKKEDNVPRTNSSVVSMKSVVTRHQFSKLRWPKRKSRDIESVPDKLKEKDSSLGGSSSAPAAASEEFTKVSSEPTLSKIITVSKYIGVPGLNKLVEASKKSVKYTDSPSQESPRKEDSADSDENGSQSIDITILWLALNEECEAMINPNVQRLYVAYSFLGMRGADLETPNSLPKPKHYADKCYFNFKKTFHLHECDLPLLGHMSRCRAGGGVSTDPRDCIVFTLVSEPPEDPLGLSACEDIGYAYLYLGDVLAYSGGSGGYTEVIGVHGVRGGVCGVLAVRVDNLPVLRRCLTLSHSQRDLTRVTVGDPRSMPHHSSVLPMYEVLHTLTTAPAVSRCLTRNATSPASPSATRAQCRTTLACCRCTRYYTR